MIVRSSRGRLRKPTAILIYSLECQDQDDYASLL